MQAHKGGHREVDEGRRRGGEKNEVCREAAFADLRLRGAEGAVLLQCHHLSGIDAGKPVQLFS